MAKIINFSIDESPSGLLKQCSALTGGIATGKSTVAVMMKELGANIVDTDAIAREIVRPGGEIIKKIIDIFGTGYLCENGSLNRSLMRDAIMNSVEKRLALNGIMHPAIMDITVGKIRGAVASGRNPVIVDVPLLFETGWDKFFSLVILVYIPEEIQVERLMKRDSLGRAAAMATLAAQIGIDKKRDVSNIIIDNSGSLESTRVRVKKAYARLKNR